MEITAIIGLGKAMLGLVEKISDRSVKIELQGKIIEMQTAVMEVQGELAQLKEEKRAWDKSDEIQKSLRFERNAYWRTGDDPPRP